DNVRARMAAPGAQQSTGKALPVVTFSDTTTYHLNGHTIHAFHVEHAHTDGDAIIHIANLNIIHAGDILFNGLYPFIDLKSGGSVDGYIAAMERIMALADSETKIIAGHGPLGTKADVGKSIAMVKEAKFRVTRLVDEGKSLEEIQAIDPLADFHADWTWAFIDGQRFTATLYNDLTGQD
ncbi:MAG TPA: MBL fold metallo-hydrolase, partial [Oceanipulchritudo sp.]|nr:MBL fold metallo-hydrolase [Oceanipulchritudo sp.]